MTSTNCGSDFKYIAYVKCSFLIISINFAWMPCRFRSLTIANSSSIAISLNAISRFTIPIYRRVVKCPDGFNWKLRALTSSFLVRSNLRRRRFHFAYPLRWRNRNKVSIYFKHFSCLSRLIGALIYSLLDRYKPHPTRNLKLNTVL